ncbi:glycosyltransferase family 4 protein [Aestuariivivens sediminicola]|uniref:glycosyltransferase family 4 protein n=1 Tax=Aestuariivivens sediminicola TaxID=2913560 RepID=UPI001F59FAD7|nr:glycosyltransferase family 1 protein [Aestuariivivens sediminicola]
MKIGIEAQRLFRPHKHGMDRVAQELIKNLQVIDKNNEYVVFVKPDRDTDAISETANFSIVEIPGGPYPYWEQIKLPKMAKQYNCDILHCTGNTAPIRTKIPLVTTLHDIIFMEDSVMQQLRNGASWYQKVGNLYRRIILNGVVKNSQRLITVSDFEKENIVDAFKEKSIGHIQTIHNGVSTHFMNSADLVALNHAKIKYNLPDNYMLHLANKDPRKNTKNVIKAFEGFLRTTRIPYKLVMLGYTKEDLVNTLKEIQSMELMNKVILPGYVPDRDLPAIYSLSQLFLFPSLREGFGIPIIEAMACGVPVITSNTSSMPEIAGDAACLVDPNHTESILQGIIKIETDTDYKEELIKKGLERCQLFSWRQMALQILDVYNNLYNDIKA